MEIEEVYRRDLNLLVALRVLIEESSVSKAAARLHLTQSAMSRVLGRLRDMLDDPLFTRQGQRLIPTEKALETNRMFAEPLQVMCQMLSQQSFEPSQCDKTFVVATTDYAMKALLPHALPKIYQHAPQVAFEFIPVQHERLTEQLTHDGADLVICRPTVPLAGLHSERLGDVGVMCLLAASHPLAEQNLTLDDYLFYPHAMIAISDGVRALIEQALSHHPARKVSLSASHLEVALALIDSIPLIITVPADLAYLVAARHNMVVKPLPFSFAPFEYSMIWHQRSEYSKSQQWLRDMVKKHCGEALDHPKSSKDAT
ncbi:LysR family transcriptional regulator [Vibrio profundum]|uniref:LysR family transcriptional regulator n=1 Tax=Vibrio profundum TaxID=2910247 RepID=UPI003D0AE972